MVSIKKELHVCSEHPTCSTTSSATFVSGVWPTTSYASEPSLVYRGALILNFSHGIDRDGNYPGPYSLGRDDCTHPPQTYVAFIAYNRA